MGISQGQISSYNLLQSSYLRGVLQKYRWSLRAAGGPEPLCFVASVLTSDYESALRAGLSVKLLESPFLILGQGLGPFLGVSLLAPRVSRDLRWTGSLLVVARHSVSSRAGAGWAAKARGEFHPRRKVPRGRAPGPGPSAFRGGLG